MPGFRSRVAAVRQHPSEGGVSLFMPRATVAALALRGAVAGARLRERFSDDAQWERHRWLRLRVAASALEDTRVRLVRARPLYEDLLEADGNGLDRLAEVLTGDPTLPARGGVVPARRRVLAPRRRRAGRHVRARRRTPPWSPAARRPSPPSR